MRDRSTSSAGSKKSFVAFVALICLTGQSASALATHSANLASIYGRLSEQEAAAAANHVQDALERAPSHQKIRWRGSGGRVYGTVTPLRTFKIKSGHYCREFVEAIAVGPDFRSEVQIACRDDLGHWQRVQSNGARAE